MSEIYIFSQDDELLTILTEETGLNSAPFRDEKNSVASEPFVFTVDADEDRAKHVKEENRVVFKDKDGFFREMVIKELDDTDNNDGPQTMATCLPAWLDELSEHYVLDKRYTDKEAQLPLNDALAGTRYIGAVEVSLGLASTNFYRLSSVDCIWKIISVWGGEFKDVVEFTGNKITTRKILLLQRLGADNGARFEIDHNIEEIQRTVLSYPKTAMYGWGASLETEGGGHTRYIDFANVEWSVAKGDPVDKPKGQTWVGDPDALLKYGRKHDGQLLHRFSEFSNQDYEDPEELLWATWNNLQDNKEPVVNYKLSVDLLDKDVSLGDGAVAIDRQFARPIEIQTRVIAIEYDLLDIEGTAVVEMGQFLNLGDDDIYRDIEDLKNEVTKPRPTKPITDESFPDIVPGIPVNIVTDAAMGAIQLYWEYDSEVYISHYEVYGSQVADFVPDSQHLLWRGRVSTFVHTVGTDQTWYYYLRAVNTRGTASSFSQRVSASTYRVMSDDILFGELIADHFKDGLDIADKLTQNTIDRINEGPMQEIVYTQQEIAATEDRLLSQLNSEIGDVNASISSLLDRTKGIEGTITSINQEVDDIEGKLLTTITKLTNLDGVVSAQETTLQQHAGLISAKAEKSEVYTKTQTNNLLGNKVDFSVYSNKMSSLDISINGINQTVSNTQATVNKHTGEIATAKSDISAIDQKAEGISTQVSSLRNDLSSTQSQVAAINVKADGIISTVENIQIGGSNLLLDSRIKNITSNNSTNYPITTEVLTENGLTFRRVRPAPNSPNPIISLYETIPGSDITDRHWAGQDITFSIRVRASIKGVAITLRPWVTTTTARPPTVSIVSNGEWQTISCVWKVPDNVQTSSTIRFMPAITSNMSGQYLDIWGYQIEKSNKASDWRPAVEDGEKRLTKAESSIEQTAKDILLKVNKDGVIASINLSPEGVRINGNKHHITGQTLIDDAVIGTAAMANLSVTNAKLGLLSVGTAQMQNLSVVNGKIGNLAVDDAKIANISVSKLKAGEMDTSKITIRGGSSIDYMLIDGSRLESRGRYNMRWHNKSKTIDASLYLANGNFRVANWTDSRSIFLTPFGLSTFADGYGDGTSSGMLEFFSEEFEAGTHGITLASQLGVAGIKSFRNRVVMDAYASANIESRQSPVYFRPYKDLRVGNNVFAMTVVSSTNAALTEGILHYGSDASGYASGLRFSKAASNPWVAVVDGAGARGGNATFDAGIVQANRFTKRDGSADAYFNGTGGGTLLTTNPQTPLMADGIRATSDFFYIGSDGGTKVTNGAGYNYGNGLVHKPIWASAFTQVSEIKYKTNIEALELDALSLINNTDLTRYNLKDDLAEGNQISKLGVIIGGKYNTPKEIINPDGDAIDLYAMTTMGWKAIQELDTKVYDVETRVDKHDLEIQYLKQKIVQQDDVIASQGKRIKHLENLLEVA
ncbi:phage tail spike protein [Bacillus sp. FSL K6-3431]|uniref:phage tail spike protein n=1 Tax=Bacillus sp. FSL K6-3431 TaxID=2921500 RepID=UPI0030F5B6F1